MFCFLTVRKLKPGAYDDFRAAWEPEGDPPEGFARAYHLRNISDENEVISFGFFEGSREDIDRLRAEVGEAREEQVRKINEYVESIGADGVYEVVEEYTPPGR
jgi:hypothetical protein